MKGDECGYLFPNEFSNLEFRGALEQTLEDNDDNFFVVQEKDSHLHVLAYQKTRVWADVCQQVEAPKREDKVPKRADVCEIDESGDEVHDEGEAREGCEDDTEDSRS